MDFQKANSIIDGYVGWWRSQVSIYPEGDAVRIVCPMLDRHNDHMSIYLSDIDEGGYLLTDLGAVLGDLEMSGCDVLSSGARRMKLEEVLSSFGLRQADGELYRKTGESGLFQSINMLMQGMASVDDLFFTAKENARNFFLDDVRAWLDSHEIRYSPGVVLQGRSGFATRFDFCIPKTGTKAPERLIKAIGAPSESNIKNALFGWEDIRESREGSKGYLFMNMIGGTSKEASVDPMLENACLAYGVRPVHWIGSADDVLAELAA